ncbi:MAG: hypothetical protein AB1458_09980 [Bacteroidota bacterium]
MKNRKALRYYWFHFFIAISGLISCKFNSQTEEAHILRAGIGFDNIELSKLTLSDVKERFGDKFKTDTSYLQPIINQSSLDSSVQGKRKIYSFRLFYESSGISFYFKPDSNQITALKVEKPFNGQTDKGIVLSKSTFREIIAIYGDSAWEFTGNYIAKGYNGIRFYRQFYHAMVIPDSILAKYLDSTVTAISINHPTQQ